MVIPGVVDELCKEDGLVLIVNVPYQSLEDLVPIDPVNLRSV